MSIDKIKDYLNSLELSEKNAMIAEQIMQELNKLEDKEYGKNQT